MVEIRSATIDDILDITEIYNDAIENTVATFDTEKKTVEEQKEWFRSHGSKYPIIVAEKENEIVGWAALSKYSTRCAYSDTSEISLYVKEKYQKQGIGKTLINEIVKAGEESGLHAILARITDGNKVSIHIHESVGFTHVGVLKEVGLKFGRRLDVYLMEKIYKKEKK